MRLTAMLARLDAVQQGQRGALMPWAPVLMGIGVVIYFTRPAEPGMAAIGLAGAGIVLGLALFLWRRERLGPLGLALLLLTLGGLAAGLKAHQAAGPVLDYRYYGAIEGRVVAIDRSGSDRLRMTLADVRLEDRAPERTPRRVRVSLHGDPGLGILPTPGATVMLTGFLSGPSGPAEPGGFDFERHAWFLKLGAVGYTRNPVVLLEPRPPGAAVLFEARMRLADAIRAEIPGQPGAFAAAVLTGDRSGLSLVSIEAMRDSNIAHLLAISGLHMGLLTGFVYAALRFGLALIRPVALRYPIRKWAAFVALIAGAFYLGLSGGNVATERAFIQVAVMFTAVMLDRRAITLRSVAIAAIIVLLHRPETLMSPGFQMSFAATAALVGVFGAMRGAQWVRAMPKWSKGMLALVVSSVVAGAATAPFAAAHFNQIAVYGLVANLLTVPVMGSLIIPGAVLALLIWPLGLAGPVFVVIEWGLAWILGVSSRIAALPGATEPVMAPPAWVLGAIALGALVVLIWQGRARWVGAAPILAAFIAWSAAERPVLLISESGRLAGLMTPEGRALSRPRGDGFVARIWLENDGDAADQGGAASRDGWRAEGYGAAASIGAISVWHGSGIRAAREADAACARHDLVILSEPAETPRLRDGAAAMAQALHPPARAGGAAQAAEPGRAPCLVVAADLLRDTGALAIAPDATGAGITVVTARDRQGLRLWSGGS